MHQAVSRLRAFLADGTDLAVVLRGAGLVVCIRVLASAVGFGSVVLLARWMGPAEYGLYSFAIACMSLLASAATLGLAGASVRFVAQYKTAEDWPLLTGFTKASSLLTAGVAVLISILAIVSVLSLRPHSDAAHLAPTLLALTGVPIVALGLVKSESLRGLGQLLLAWGAPQIGQPLLLLALSASLLLTARLDAASAVGASIVAYAVILAVQWGVLRSRLGERARVEPKFEIRTWLSVAASFLWSALALLVFIQGGIVVAGLFLAPQDVAVYSAAAATAGFATLPIHAAVALGAPRFAALQTERRWSDLEALYADIVRWAFWPSLAIALFFLLFGPMVLRLFGPGFERGYPAFVILTLAFFSGALTGPVTALLSMTGHQKVAARTQITFATLAVGLGLTLTPLWGTIGTAIAFAAAIMTMNVWLMLTASRELKFLPLISVRRRS